MLLVASRTRALVAILFGLVLIACGGESGSSPEPSTGPDGETINLEDGKFDSVGEVKVRATAVTVWVDTTLEWRDAEQAFVLSGRASKDLAGVSAFLHSRPVALASQISARKFELALGRDDLLDVLRGERVFIELLAGAGSVPKYTLSVKIRARIENTSGSSKIYLHKNIVPVLLDGEVIYRGRATVALGYTDLTGTNDDDSEPQTSQENDKLWKIDWASWALWLSASPPEDAMHFSVADTGGARVRRQGEIHIKLRQLGITTLPPFEVWPVPACEQQVSDCLTQLSGGDTENCGEAAEVQLCKKSTGPSAGQFASDLTSHLVSYYAAHGSDIAATGGNTLADAQAAVDVGKITTLTDPDEDPHAHDLTSVTVLSHPDVIFPGSDIVWFGAYETASGKLLEVYDFN
jgi:hypothetical protein